MLNLVQGIVTIQSQRGRQFTRIIIILDVEYHTTLLISDLHHLLVSNNGSSFTNQLQWTTLQTKSMNIELLVGVTDVGHPQVTYKRTCPLTRSLTHVTREVGKLTLRGV